MKITFEKVTTAAQVETVAEIAAPIWHATYDAINGVESTNYMLEKFQSPAAVERQMKTENYRYFLIEADGQPAGFAGLVPHKENKLFLSKLYLSDAFRGAGIPRRAFAFIEGFAQGCALSAIYLTVNKKNLHAIDVYKHFGFYETDAVVTDIGGGFVMNDYILQKDI